MGSNPTSATKIDCIAMNSWDKKTKAEQVTSYLSFCIGVAEKTKIRAIESGKPTDDFDSILADLIPMTLIEPQNRVERLKEIEDGSRKINEAATKHGLL